MQDQRRYDANKAYIADITDPHACCLKGGNKREGLPTLVLQKAVSSYLTNFRITRFSAVLVRCDACKGAFRPLSLCPPLLSLALSLSHSLFLSKTAPSSKPRNRDGRLRERNEQYDISPLPSFPSRFLCSSLIFYPSLCFFLLSISLSPPSHSLSLSLCCLLAPSPFFPHCALNTNTLSLLSLCLYSPASAKDILMYVGRVEEKRERSGLWVPECVCVLVGSRDGGGL